MKNSLSTQAKYRLCRLPQAGFGASVGRTTTPNCASTHGMASVLFVDDEPAIRDTLPQILRQRGHEVTVAATVAEALGQMTSRPFDLLIADLNIGEPGDGFTVVSAMRRTHPNCINIILTGYPG